MTFQRPSRDEARAELVALVGAYRTHATAVEAPGSHYSEAQVRLDFLDKLLNLLGWDVHNQAAKHQDARDVVVELSLTEDGSTGRPDYRLRVDGRDRIPWEAKKPSLDLALSTGSAHQVRSYGFTLQRPAAVLSNFGETVIYDCTIEVNENDGPEVAVIPECRFAWHEYVDRFDDLWQRLSYESVGSDQFYAIYDYEEPPRGQSAFDKTFLSKFREWRNSLAQDIADGNLALPAAEVGRRTQRLLNALLFLRVCEDRNISKYKDLLRSAENDQILDEFTRADRLYNAGLFSVLQATNVGADALREVVTQLYWPQSKFAYALLEPDTLSAVYEQYLAERVVLDSARRVRIEEKPELTHTGGVVPTPAAVVDTLLDAGLSEQDLSDAATIPSPSILDPACGSGVFLVRALQRLIAAREESGTHLKLSERAALAKDCIFGVDIDAEAVEVARLSLLLVVLGGEFVDVRAGRGILPDLASNVQVGNSLVGPDFDRLVPGQAAIPEVRAQVAPFDWAVAFPAVANHGGFTCIVGNPPYIRIQVLREFLPAQLTYFQDPRSGYKTSTGSFDAYMLFMEKCLSLLSATGTMALIVKSSLLISPSASLLRERLGTHLVQLVHFGSQQVFPGRSTYTCLVVASGSAVHAAAEMVLVNDASSFLRAPSTAAKTAVDRSELTSAPWVVASKEAAMAFTAMEGASVARLGDEGWVKIFVGVQTSADSVFYLRSLDDDGVSSVVKVKDAAGLVWEIERTILRESVKDVRLAPYGAAPQSDCMILFPYQVTPPRPGKIRGKATPYTYADLARNFPKALEYIEANESRLRSRSISPDPGEAYWVYGRSQSLTVLDAPKVINRTLSVVPQYVPDTSGLVTPGGGDGGPYTLLRPAPQCSLTIEAVIALLSHPIVDAYVASRSKEYRGAYVVHRRATLEPVPVPPLSDEEVRSITMMVREAQSLELRLRSEPDTTIVASLRGRRTSVVRQVEDMITVSYGLTPAQISFLQD